MIFGWKKKVRRPYVDERPLQGQLQRWHSAHPLADRCVLSPGDFLALVNEICGEETAFLWTDVGVCVGGIEVFSDARAKDGFWER